MMSPMLSIVVALIALSLALAATISSQVIVIALLLNFTKRFQVVVSATISCQRQFPMDIGFSE